MQISQTNIQLYNQLRDKALPLDDLLAVHRAYELLTTLYSGCFQADGKPFVAHGVGVASILAELDQPIEFVVAGMVHNVYGNGDFGDGRGPGETPARRRLVRQVVGERVEQLVARFPQLRIEDHGIETLRRSLPQRSEDERRVIVIDLADYLEKCSDLGVLYFGENDWVLGVIEPTGDQIAELASELGEPRLAELLSSAFSSVVAHQHAIPPQLRPSDRRRHMKLVIPRSCQQRARLRLRVQIHRLRDLVRLRTRLRALSQPGRRRDRAAA
jgi:(p)ppGpp synthase/HD superfamily hydrolase